MFPAATVVPVFCCVSGVGRCHPDDAVGVEVLLGARHELRMLVRGVLWALDG